MKTDFINQIIIFDITKYNLTKQIIELIQNAGEAMKIVSTHTINGVKIGHEILKFQVIAKSVPWIKQFLFRESFSPLSLCLSAFQIYSA